MKADKKGLPGYYDVLEYLKKEKRKTHLLLGNGFSISYDAKIFSYNALSEFIDRVDDERLHKLFGIIKTNNFELLMKQLDDFSRIAKIFGANKLFINKVKKTSEKLKGVLINAIKELHPEHVFTIPEEKNKACASFINYYIKNGGNIFTANYDLLLYWILMRNGLENAIDGFGREVEDAGEYVPEEELEYSELRWGKHKENQTIHYLHGAMQLFDAGIDIIKEEYTSQDYLLTNIKKRLDNKEYPIFVTAGNGREKLAHIRHNRYLSYCYDRFSSIQGSLVTFGFNFGEYDDHIIEAINMASKYIKGSAGKLYSIYIGVYSEADLKHIKSIKNKFKCKVNMFDAKTAKVWG